MIDLVPLFFRRALPTLFVLLLLVGLSAATNTTIIDLTALKQIKVSDQPLSDKFISISAFSLAAALLLIMTGGYVRSHLRQSLDLASQPLKGLYHTSIQYNRRVLHDNYRQLIEPHWNNDEVILPSTGNNDEDYDIGVQRMVKKLDELGKFEAPFYEHYRDLETSFDLYIETRAFEHAKDVFCISGFGKIVDRLRAGEGGISECGILIHDVNRERDHNVIDLRGIRKKWQLFRKGVCVVLEFEQLVHPQRRHREFNIYLSFLLKRRFFAAQWVLTTGIFLIKSGEDSLYYALGHTDNFVVR